MDCESKGLEYEEKDICLGMRSMLEPTLRDFKKKAEDDVYCDTEFFVPENLLKDDNNNSITLDFLIHKIEI